MRVDISTIKETNITQRYDLPLKDIYSLVVTNDSNTNFTINDYQLLEGEVFKFDTGNIGLVTNFDLTIKPIAVETIQFSIITAKII